MTPSLSGRINSRIAITSIAGLIASLVIIIVIDNISLIKLLNILLISIMIGVVCDNIYSYLQNKRWDRDWPPVLLLAGAIIELIILRTTLNILQFSYSLTILLSHYALTWIISMIITFQIMHIISPVYKFSAGRVSNKKTIIDYILQNK